MPSLGGGWVLLVARSNVAKTKANSAAKAPGTCVDDTLGGVYMSLSNIAAL